MSSLTATAIMGGNNLVTFELDHTVEVKLLGDWIEFRFELVIGRWVLKSASEWCRWRYVVNRIG